MHLFLMVALQISRYNPLRRVAAYRRKHGDIRDLRYTDSEAIIQSYDPGTAVKTYKQKQKRLSDEEVRQEANNAIGFTALPFLERFLLCHVLHKIHGSR